MQQDMPSGNQYLEPTEYLDFEDPAVRRFIDEHRGPGSSAREQAISLYYAVRDNFRYDPYRIEYAKAGFKASTQARQDFGYCIPKAVLLAAAARGVGIPARLGFGDVRNHLTTERLRESMQTDIFPFHGYAQLWIDGAWVKATPAFNKSMCDKFGVRPLEFDGVHDSLFHEFDSEGRKHMEYVVDRGQYDDLPYQEIMDVWNATIPNTMPDNAQGTDPDGLPREFAPDN